MKIDPDDEIVSEVRQRRQDILASYGGDIERMTRDVMERQWRSGRRVVRRPPAPAEPETSPLPAAP